VSLRQPVEWWATFDCSDGDVQTPRTQLAHEGFAKWLSSLRAQLASLRGDSAPA
jgi:hypothetical protein